MDFATDLDRSTFEKTMDAEESSSAYQAESLKYSWSDKMMNRKSNISRKAIRIKLSGIRNLDYMSYPVIFGIPFSDGILANETPVRLVDRSGRALPTQIQPLAFWNKDLKFVKWLLVDIQVDAFDGEHELILEYPATEAPPKLEQSLSIKERGGIISVDTSVMRLYLKNTFNAWQQPNNPDVFARCLVKTEEGWHDVFRGNPGPFLYMKDQDGNYYDSCTASPTPRVVVEEAGPLRACIRINGYHATKQGQRFCPYILRLHLYAGKSDIRIFHTFIYDQEPHQIELSTIGMKFPLDLGDKLRAAFGGGGDIHWAGNWRKMSMLQRNDRNYEVFLNDCPFGTGEKSAGWTSLNGTQGSAMAVIRNCWQEYPKGFGLSRDGMDVQIWPEGYHENLVFTTPFEEPAVRFESRDNPGPVRDEEEVQRILKENPTAPLNLKSLNIRSLEETAWVEDVIEKHAQGRTMTYNDTGTSNGIGAAKTTEIYLRFSGESMDDNEAQKLARSIQEPLVAVVEPEYICDTGALGHFYPEGNPQFAQVDEELNDLFQLAAVDPIEPCRLYGMMRYGNMVCSHSSAVGWVYLLYKDTDPSKALRYVGPYNNEAVDQIMAVWGHFIRTGKREHLLLAQNYSRCVADVSFVHAHPSHPDSVGLMHYHNGHQWSGGLSPSHSIISGILTDYYFTGNRRLLDVAKEAAERIVRTQEPAGILSCHGTLHREFTGPLSILMDIYQATWEEKYGSLAERSLNWLLRTVTIPGRLPNSVFTRGPRGDEAVVQPPCLPEVSWGNKYHLYEPALRLFPSKALRDFVIAESDYWVWQSPKDMLNYACTTVCFAYDLTKDMNYAAYARNLMDTNFHDFAEQMQSGERMDFQALWFSSFIPRLMAIVAHAMAGDAAGFARASEQWRQKRLNMPDREEEERPDKEPVTNLGKVSTEPHSTE